MHELGYADTAGKFLFLLYDHNVQPHVQIEVTDRFPFSLRDVGIAFDVADRLDHNLVLIAGNVDFVVD